MINNDKKINLSELADKQMAAFILNKDRKSGNNLNEITNLVNGVLSTLNRAIILEAINDAKLIELNKNKDVVLSEEDRVYVKNGLSVLDPVIFDFRKNVAFVRNVSGMFRYVLFTKYAPMVVIDEKRMLSDSKIGCNILGAISDSIEDLSANTDNIFGCKVPILLVPLSKLKNALEIAGLTKESKKDIDAIETFLNKNLEEENYDTMLKRFLSNPKEEKKLAEVFSELFSAYKSPKALAKVLAKIEAINIGYDLKDLKNPTLYNTCDYDLYYRLNSKEVINKWEITMQSSQLSALMSNVIGSISDLELLGIENISTKSVMVTKMFTSFLRDNKKWINDFLQDYNNNDKSNSTEEVIRLNTIIAKNNSTICKMEQEMATLHESKNNADKEISKLMRELDESRNEIATLMDLYNEDLSKQETNFHEKLRQESLLIEDMYTEALNVRDSTIAILEEELNLYKEEEKERLKRQRGENYTITRETISEMIYSTIPESNRFFVDATIVDGRDSKKQVSMMIKSQDNYNVLRRTINFFTDDPVKAEIAALGNGLIEILKLTSGCVMLYSDCLSAIKIIKSGKVKFWEDTLSKNSDRDVLLQWVPREINEAGRELERYANAHFAKDL